MSKVNIFPLTKLLMARIGNWAGCIAAVLAMLFAGAPATAQSPAALTKVRYEETVRSVLYLPTYVALNQGYFKQAGLDVSVRTSQGTEKGMAALLSGSADIVLIGPEAAIYVANSESPVKPKIFCGLTATDGFLLMARQRPVGKFAWNSVKGQSVMSFRPGSNPDVFLAAAFRKNGVSPQRDLKMLSNISPAARLGAWLAGQGDYAIFMEPEATMLERKGQGYAVASIGSPLCQTSCRLLFSRRMTRWSDKHEPKTTFPRI